MRKLFKYSAVAAVFIIGTFAGLAALKQHQQDSYKRGVDDGYAAGYNSKCTSRVTMIEGNWDNAHYTRGYRIGEQRGISDGTMDCPD